MDPGALGERTADTMAQTIAFIGTGAIGSALARLAVAAGLDVLLSNSRGPNTLTAIVAELDYHARAATPEEAARSGDLVVVATPLKAYATLPVEPLKRWIGCSKRMPDVSDSGWGTRWGE